MHSVRRFLGGVLAAACLVATGPAVTATAATPKVAAAPCAIDFAPGRIMTAGQTLTVTRAAHCSVALAVGRPTFRLVVDLFLLYESPGAKDGALDYWSSSLVVNRPATNNTTTLSLQTDGNLVLRNASGAAVWVTQTRGSGAVSLSLQTDGNLVLRNAAGAAVWATYTPVPMLLAGKIMPAGGRFGYNGYTVIENGQAHAVPSALLYVRPDGNLQLVVGGVLRWTSNTHVPGSHLIMQTDGNLVLRAPDGHATWASGTRGFLPNPFAFVAGPYLVISDDNHQLRHL